MWEYQDTEDVIYKYLIPLVCVPGLCAATASAYVFFKMRQTSLDVLLCGLSCFDVFVLACSLVIYPSMNACAQKANPIDHAVCHFFWKSTLIAYPLSLMAQCGSVWTCVSITVDRFVAVSFPIQKRVWCTPATSFTVLSVVTIFSVIYKLPAFLEIELNPDGVIIPTKLREDPMYILLYHAYCYVLMMLLIPWTIIIVLNGIVIQRVREAYGARKNLTQNHSSSFQKRDDNERRCTVMALVMTALFVLCNLPTGINNLIETFTVYQKIFRHRIPISNLLVCVNSASNIVIYCLFNRKFRRTCVRVLAPWLYRRSYSESDKKGVLERTASFMVGGFAVRMLMEKRALGMQSQFRSNDRAPLNSSIRSVGSTKNETASLMGRGQPC